MAFALSRPEVFEPLYTVSSFSFPSGHSLISFCLWGFAGAWYLLNDPARPRRWIVMLLCLALAALIAVSRLYIGVHWPTDVVAGMLLATFWVTVCLAGREWFLKRLRGRPVPDAPP